MITNSKFYYLKLAILIWVLTIFIKTFGVDIYRVSSISMKPTLMPNDYVIVSKFSYKIRTPEHFPFTNISIPYFSFTGLQSVQRGDIIVFHPPHFINGLRKSESVVFVKRCIGIPGDTIKLENGKESIPKEKYLKFLREISKFGVSKSVRVPRRDDTINISMDTNPIIWDLIRGEGHIVEINNNIVLVDGKKMSTYVVKKNYLFMLGDNRWKSVDSRVWGFVPEDQLIGKVIYLF